MNRSRRSQQAAVALTTVEATKAPSNSKSKKDAVPSLAPALTVPSLNSPTKIPDTLLSQHRRVVLRKEQRLSTSRHIDVMVWGGSRPDLLVKTLESFFRHAKLTRGQFHFYLDDGVFDSDKAEEARKVALKYGFENITLAKTGSYGFAMAEAFSRDVSSPYVFSLEDDWELQRDIDFDVVLDCMEANPTINQIRFNRRKNEDTNYYRDLKGDYFRHYASQLPLRKLLSDGRGGQWPVLGSLNWYFNPALWRTSFIMPRFIGTYRNVHSEFNHILTQYGPRPPPSWYMDTLGAVCWGDVRDAMFFKHLGGGERSIHNQQGFV